MHQGWRRYHRGAMHTTWDAVEAFLDEHRGCGDLDAGVDDGRVWMTCECGGAIRWHLSDGPVHPTVQRFT